MESNFWFYTLSAIPQTLAAMFALVIAVLVYRFEALNKVLERDITLSKEFLFPIFREMEIDDIERMNSREYLARLTEALSLKLKRDKEKLGLSNKDYNDLFDIYKRKIEEFHRFYNPDEKRIYSYLLEKRDSIDTHIKIERVVSRSFFVLSIFTGFTISISLYFLPKYSFYSNQPVFILKLILFLAIFNVFIITTGVLIMVFTKRFLKLVGIKVT